MRKAIAITGLWLGLFGGIMMGTTSASAKTLPKISTSNITYASSKLKVKVKVPKTAKLVAVKYRNHTSYYKVKKSHASVSYKFSGYRTFELYGTTSKHKRVTQMKKLTSNAYATTDIIDFGEQRTTTNATITVHTLGAHRQVTIYRSGKALKSLNTGNGQSAHFTLSLSQYQPKLTYTVRAKNRKTSLPFSIPYLKTVGNLDAIS